MFPTAGQPKISGECVPYRQKAPKMSSKTGTWLIAAGVVVGIIGIVMLPAALGEHPDMSLLMLGACGISLGSIVAASGIYLKARALQASPSANGTGAETKNSTKRVR